MGLREATEEASTQQAGRTARFVVAKGRQRQLMALKNYWGACVVLIQFAMNPC